VYRTRSNELESQKYTGLAYNFVNVYLLTALVYIDKEGSLYPERRRHAGSLSLIVIHQHVMKTPLLNLTKQGVALTGRNTIGPPRAAPW